ncbi:MAG TPA: acetamidase/formamidase family protein [Gaiellaceae bacterium]|nr:acetamidase/formamidase family protein [Gaiellaceae bacterium]
MAVHELPLEPRSLHGYFSRELEPVVEVEPGDSVSFSVPNHAWDVSPGEPFPRPRPELDVGHALAGPIAVRGARAGQTLAVRIDSVEPGDWGVTHTGEDHSVHWVLADGVGRALGLGVRLVPFLGVMGMPPPEPGTHPTRPPRRFGGNMDCKELVAGATLFLPIPVDGALFSAGDGHAAQGDGEVSGTAIETPVRAQVTLSLRDDLPLKWPLARIDGAWVALGFDEELGAAASFALAGILGVMGRELGLTGGNAVALASVVVDLRVTQVVNGVQGVHAVLRDDALV